MATESTYRRCIPALGRKISPQRRVAAEERKKEEKKGEGRNARAVHFRVLRESVRGVARE